jgi:hypothetical protein
MTHSSPDRPCLAAIHLDQDYPQCMCLNWALPGEVFCEDHVETHRPHPHTSLGVQGLRQNLSATINRQEGRKRLGEIDAHLLLSVEAGDLVGQDLWHWGRELVVEVPEAHGPIVASPKARRPGAVGRTPHSHSSPVKERP